MIFIKHKKKGGESEKMQRGAWGGWESGGCEIESGGSAKIRKGWEGRRAASPRFRQMQFRTPEIPPPPTLRDRFIECQFFPFDFVIVTVKTWAPSFQLKIFFSINKIMFKKPKCGPLAEENESDDDDNVVADAGPKKKQKSRAKPAPEPLPTDEESVLQRFSDLKDVSDLKSCCGGLTKISDGNLYKQKREKGVYVPVVYYENHNMFYTKSEIQEMKVLSYNNFKFLERKSSMERDKLLILNEKKDNTMLKPERPCHPDHVFRVVDQTKPKKLNYATGDGKSILPGLLAPEYAQTVEDVEKKFPDKKCLDCKRSDVSFGILFNGNNYCYTSYCEECNKQKVKEHRHQNIQTIEGKALILAKSAVQNQTKRKDVPNLILEVHKLPLADVFGRLLKGALHLPLCIEIGLKPYHFSNDKLDDIVKVYIGATKETLFTNLSVTPNICNSMSKPELALIKNTNNKDFTIPNNDLEVLHIIRQNIGKKGGAANYGDNKLAKQIAEQLNIMCNHAKNHQNKRIKTGRSFKEMDNNDVIKLKKRLIRLYIAQKGRCFISGFQLDFTTADPAMRPSIDRLDNDVGYDVKENLSLVCRFFNTELHTVKDNDDIIPLNWSPALFDKHGLPILSGGCTFKYTDLPLAERKELEEKYKDIIAT